MRSRRHTIDTPPPVDRVGTLCLLVVDEGSFLAAPSATEIDLHLPASRGLPSWGAVGSALAVQAPGAFVASTRHIVVVMYSQGVRLLKTLDDWETARKTPFDLITRLVVLRADTGLPLPSVPGAAEAYSHLAGVLCTCRPGQPSGGLPLNTTANVNTYTQNNPSAADSPLGTTLNSTLAPHPAFPPLFASRADWQGIPLFAPLHERRGIDLPILQIPRRRRPTPQDAISAHSLQASISTRCTTSSSSNNRSDNRGDHPSLQPQPSTRVQAQPQAQVQATPLTGKASWGNWFAWSP